MKAQSAVKVTCILERQSIGPAMSVLSEAKAGNVSVQNSRNACLRSARSPFGLRSRVVLDERACEIVRALIPAQSETEVMEAIVERAGLAGPGRGSVFSESAQLRSGAGLDLSLAAPRPGRPLGGGPKAAGGSGILQGSLIGVSSVVQRDQGNTLARSILEMGLSVPNLSYGQGMGLRSKLGLLRVTIPAGKEIVFFMAHKDDAEEALALASETIGLEVPGRGFIYSFPIRKGLADTRIQLETGTYHVATMEQVIAAIDGLSGGSDWRRRSALLSAGQEARRGRRPELAKRRKADASLVNLNLSCADGLAAEYLDLTMQLGANGATLSQIQGLSFAVDPEGERTARESADLILEADKAAGIIESIETMGFFSEEVGGIAEITAVAESIAYSGKKR